MKDTGAVILTVRDKVTPIMGREIGQRMVIVHPNKARWDENSGEYKTSYAPNQVIAEMDLIPGCEAMNNQWIEDTLTWLGNPQLIIE